VTDTHDVDSKNVTLRVGLWRFRPQTKAIEPTLIQGGEKTKIPEFSLIEHFARNFDAFLTYSRTFVTRNWLSQDFSLLNSPMTSDSSLCVFVVEKKNCRVWKIFKKKRVGDTQ
jgi:hypothetical protein